MDFKPFITYFCLPLCVIGLCRLIKCITLLCISCWNLFLYWAVFVSGHSADNLWSRLLAVSVQPNSADSQKINNCQSIYCNFSTVVRK